LAWPAAIMVVVFWLHGWLVLHGFPAPSPPRQKNREREVLRKTQSD